MPDPIEVEVTVECPSHCQGAVACSVCGSAGEPGTVTAVLTGRDALVMEVGRAMVARAYGSESDQPALDAAIERLAGYDAAHRSEGGTGDGANGF